MILFSKALVVQLIDWFRDRESKTGSRSAEGVDEKYLADSPSGQTEPYTQVHFGSCLAPSEMRVLKRLPGNDQPTHEISDPLVGPGESLRVPRAGYDVPKPPISDPLLPLCSLNRAFKICSAGKREPTP